MTTETDEPPHSKTECPIFLVMTKDDYLNSRKEWKCQYMNLSGIIRDLKWMEKEAARGGYMALSRLMSARMKCGNDAHDMMNELEGLKMLSRQSVAFLRRLNDQEQRNSSSW